MNRIAKRVMFLLSFMTLVTAFGVSAQDRRATPFVWESSTNEPAWMPVLLTSNCVTTSPGNSCAPCFSCSPCPTCCGCGPYNQVTQCRAEIVDAQPYSNCQAATNVQPFQSGQIFAENPQSTFAGYQQQGQTANGQNAKSGTGLDALPSFRGIKGIKNLPGGVGTLLMANPHVGATWYPQQSTDQPGTSLSMERTYFQAGVPVYSNGPDTYVFTAHLDATKIYTNAILPTSLQSFPTQLYNVALGMNYFHQFENGNVGGIVFDAGTASDQPFQSGRDILASGTGFLLIPKDDESSWFVGVNASTNSQVLYGLPIPGGGYFYHPSENFQAIFGFPFSVVSWKPARDWQLQYVYAFLTTMHARAVYQPTQDWQLYAGFDWTNENWHRAERTNEHDHFFYYEKKLATGLLWWFAPNVGLEVSGGWAFDRYFTEVNGFKLQGDNTVNIGSGPYISSQIDVRF